VLVSSPPPTSFSTIESRKPEFAGKSVAVVGAGTIRSERAGGAQAARQNSETATTA
jgi:hypothetical protein